MTKAKVAVAGASGYAGGELLRLLLGHPEVEIGALTGGSNAGETLGSLQPHLVPLADRVLEETSAETLAGHDVVFLALPHGQSGPIAAELGEQVVVIDCGADYRLADPAAWERFYGGAHAGTWPYGLPELPGQRAQLRGAKPSRGPRLLPDGLDARARARSRRGPGRARRRRGRRVGHQRRRQGRQAAPPRQRGDGQRQAYGVGGVHRHTPEITQNLSALVDGGRCGSLHPAPGPDAAGHPGHLLGAAARRRHRGRRRGRRTSRRTATSRSCTCSPGAVAADQVGAPAPTRCTSRSPSTSAPAGWSPSVPSTTWPRAPPAPPSSA